MKLINNVQNMQQFVDQLTEGWYYIFIVARRKWCDKLPKGEVPIYRIFAEKNQIIEKIQEAEVRIDTFNFIEGEIPLESIGVYINPNTRDFCKGLKPLFHRYIENIEKFENPQDKKFIELFSSKFIFQDELLFENPFSFLDGFNSVQLITKQIHKFFKTEMKTIMSTSRLSKEFMDIDIDCLEKGNVDRELLKPIFDFIYSVTNAKLHIIETKSGAHVQICKSTIDSKFQKSWHLALNKAKNQFEGFEIDFQGGNDKLCPCPGTIQGGYVPNHYVYDPTEYLMFENFKKLNSNFNFSEEEILKHFNVLKLSMDMNIFTNSNELVICTDSNNSNLEFGKIYTLKFSDVGPKNTEVCLEEVKGVFDYSSFSNLKHQTKEQIERHPDYKIYSKELSIFLF